MKWKKTAMAVLAVLLCVSMLAGCGTAGSKPAAGGTVSDSSKDAEAQERGNGTGTAECRTKI